MVQKCYPLLCEKHSCSGCAMVVCVFVMIHALEYHGVQTVTFANKLGYGVMPNPNVHAVNTVSMQACLQDAF